MASALATGTFSLPGALAEAQWLQMLIGDVVHGDVLELDWYLKSGPFTAALSRDCEPSKVSSTLSVVDAKPALIPLNLHPTKSVRDRDCTQKDLRSSVHSRRNAI